MSTIFVGAMLLFLAHAVISIWLLTLRPSRQLFQNFFLPSLIFFWAAYALYEGVYIPRNCTGECNIRVDLLFMWPYLLFVTICALISFVRSRK